MTKRIYILTTLIISCFVAMSFGDNQNVQAADTVVKNKAQTNPDYPLGGASNFMMVAGNQYIQSTAPFNGRLMANSIVLKQNYFNFNGSKLKAGDTSNDDYFEHLANPAVVINDFSKSTTENMKNVLFQFSKMWRTDKAVGTDLSNNTQFATDTTQAAAEAKFPNMAVDLYTGTPATFANLWKNKLEPGTDGNLANLKQYTDNGINKYETSEQQTENEYSLQQNIQDISQNYGALTPTKGTTTVRVNGNQKAVANRDFWSSTDNIINFKQSATNDGIKTNPVYVRDDKWPAITDVVINIIAKADDPAIKKVAAKETKTAVDKAKTIVAIPIDRDLLIAANPGASHMNLVFHFSDSFYTVNSKGKKVLDVTKLPYTVLNYYGFGDKKVHYTFGEGDGFFIGDLNNRYLPGDSTLGEKGYARSIPEEVGAEGKDAAEDWSDRETLRFGSQLLNNFVDANDIVNNPESFNQAGLNGETAAVSYVNRNYGTMLFGTMLIPRGSFYAGGASHGLFLGAVIAANNITLDAATISPGQDKSNFGNDHNFPGLPPEKPAITIDSLDLVTPQKDSQKVVNKETAKFSYIKDDLTPAPNLGVTGTLHLANTPDSYGLYYRYNGQGDWHRYASGAQTKNTVALDESWLADLNNQTAAKAGSVKTETHKISYPLTKTNSLEFATTADAKEATIPADKIKPTATFDCTLQVEAALEVTVPAKISFGTAVLGNSSGQVQRTVAINEVQLAQKAVADTGTAEAPKVVVYNPLLSGFSLKLGYLDASATSQNPFYITNNFRYNINTAAPLPLAPDRTDGEWIDGVLKRDTTPQSLETKMSSNPLKSSSLQLHLPYSNHYTAAPNAYEAPMGWQLTR